MLSLILKIVNKIDYNILNKNIILVVILSLFFLTIPNKSNISDYKIISVIVALIAKYCLGDIDEGYQYTIYDIIYWASLFLSSLLTIFIYKKVRGL
jgi:hypothetical protein